MTLPSLLFLLLLQEVKSKCLELPKRGDHHQYDTRQRGLLDIPRKRIKRADDSLGLRLYNSLPTWIKQLEEPHFTRAIKKSLVENPCYSQEEFLKLSFGKL